MGNKKHKHDGPKNENLLAQIFILSPWVYFSNGGKSSDITF